MALGWKDVTLAGELLRGLGVTLRHLVKPGVTEQYPTERREPQERYRGLVRWDKEKCAACALCALYCPVKAISLDTAEGKDGRKVVLDYRLDASHCMTCGLCVEICPVGALSHSRHFELACYELTDLLFAGERMAGDPPITRYR